MICPKCKVDDDKVIETRPVRDGVAVRRRRKCLRCGYRYTTYEEVYREELVIVKRDGRRQTFDRSKLGKAIRRACGKRPVSDEQIRFIIDRVIAKLDCGEVASSRVAELVMGELHAVDEVAYIRFASVYREFKDVEQFLSAITEIAHK